MDSNTEKSTLLKQAANYGLILGLATVVYSLLMRSAGFAESSLTFWGYQVIISVGIAFGVKKYREDFSGGFISYGQALKLGTLIVSFSGIIQAFFVYAYYRFISPEEMTAMITAMQDMFLKMGKSDQEIEIASQLITPSYFAFIIVLKEIFKGFFFSLIIAGFLKKDPSIFED